MAAIVSQQTTDDVQEALSGFLDRVAVGLFRSSIEGLLIFGNRALASMFGFDSVAEMRKYPLIRLYRTKADRGDLVNDLLRKGLVRDRRIAFQQRDGTPLDCAVSAAAVTDADGNMEFIDGVLWEIAPENGRSTVRRPRQKTAHPWQSFSFLLDGAGTILEMEETGAALLERDPQEMIGSALSVHIDPKYRRLCDGLLADVKQNRVVKGILIFKGGSGRSLHVEIHAQVLENGAEPGRISIAARDITRTVESQQERLNRERFQGVLEMAGGVVHRLNQPLTVATNLLSEMISESAPSERHFDKLTQMREQIQKLNEIAKKIGNIRQYKSMDYVAGVRIVDIDQSS
jgi:PAS domain-containing protein